MKTIEFKASQAKEAKDNANYLINLLNKTLPDGTLQDLKDILGLNEQNLCVAGKNHNMTEVLYNRYINNILNKLGLDKGDITDELLAIYRNKAIKHFSELLSVIKRPNNYRDAYLIIGKDADNKYCIKDNADNMLKDMFTIKATTKQELEVLNTLKEIAPLYNKLMKLGFTTNDIQGCMYMVNGQYQIDDLNSDVIKSILR